MFSSLVRMIPRTGLCFSLLKTATPTSFTFFTRSVCAVLWQFSIAFHKLKHLERLSVLLLSLSLFLNESPALCHYGWFEFWSAIAMHVDVPFLPHVARQSREMLLLERVTHVQLVLSSNLLFFQRGGWVTRRHEVSRSSPLHLACKAGQLAVVEFLLEFTTSGSSRVSGLDAGRSRCGQPLLDINERDAYGHTALELAVSQGKRQLSSGFDCTVSAGSLVDTSSFSVICRHLHFLFGSSISGPRLNSTQSNSMDNYHHIPRDISRHPSTCVQTAKMGGKQKWLPLKFGLHWNLDSMM